MGIQGQRDGNYDTGMMVSGFRPPKVENDDNWRGENNVEYEDKCQCCKFQ